MLKDGVRSSRCTTIGERAYTPNIKTLASTAQTALDSTRVTPASNPSPLFFAKGSKTKTGSGVLNLWCFVDCGGLESIWNIASIWSNPSSISSAVASRASETLKLSQTARISIAADFAA